MSLPSYNPNAQSLIAEGVYTFEIMAEPEERQGAKGGKYLIFNLEIISGLNEPRKYNHIIAPWESRYGDLLLALGGIKADNGEIHLYDGDIVGKKFRGKIIHVKDLKDPTKIREKITDITKHSERDDEPY